MTWRFAMKESALMLSKTHRGILTISAWEEICIKLCGCTCRPLFNKVFKVFHNHAMHSLFGNLNLVDGCKYNVYHVTFYVNFSIITKPSKFTLRYWNRDWRGNFLDSVYNIGIGAWQAVTLGRDSNFTHLAL